MRYLVTDKTESGSIVLEFSTAKQTLASVDNMESPEIKLDISYGNGERLDRLDLKIRADREGS